MTTLNYRLGSTLDVDQILAMNGTIEKKDVRQPNILKFNALVSQSSPALNDAINYYDLDLSHSLISKYTLKQRYFPPRHPIFIPITCDITDGPLSIEVVGIYNGGASYFDTIIIPPGKLFNRE